MYSYNLLTNKNRRVRNSGGNIGWLLAHGTSAELESRAGSILTGSLHWSPGRAY